MASFARAYRAGHQHLLPFGTPSNWIQHSHSAVRAHAAPTQHLYAFHPAHPPAAASFSSYGSAIECEHQVEGVASCSASPPAAAARSLRTRSSRAEGEPIAQPKQRGWLTQILLTRRGRAQGWFSRAMGGAIACMVVISSAVEGEPGSAAPRVAAAAAAAAIAARASAAAAAPHEPAQFDAGGRGGSFVPLPNPMKGLLPDLGQFQPAAPVIEFGLAALAGYLTGCTARVVTRVGVLVIGVCGLGLYALQKQGLVELKMDRIRSLGQKLLADQQQRVEDVANRNPQVWEKMQQLVETLTMTSHGIGFSAGFLFAFR